MKPLRTAAIVAGVLIVLILGLPYLVDANSFRPKLESELTSTLGREVKVGNLSLSILTGSVSAEDLSIADDPSFSKDPFVHAKSLKVGVELMPLIFSKSLRVTELRLNQPEIALVRSANGETWNFSTLGSKATPAGAKPAVPATGESSGPANPSLSVSRLNVNHGRLTVSRAGSSTGPHVYDKVDIEVRDFAFSSSFPF